MLITCISFLGTLIAYSITCILASFIVCLTLKIILTIVFATLFVRIDESDNEE